MPIIREIFNETITDHTTSKSIQIPITTKVFPQTTLDSNIAISSIIGVTENFFKNLKYCLQETGLNISFDDAEYSFTVFGMKFYCLCYSPYPGTSVDTYVVIPSIHRYGGKITGHPFNSSGNAYFGISKAATIVEYNSNDLMYQINIHYNTNFLYITYGSKVNINATYPLCCIIKCQTINGDECLYTSLNPNVWGNTTTSNMITNYHIITMVDKPFINYPSYNNVNITKGTGTNETSDTVNLFTRINHQANGLQNFFDKEKIIKIQPICVQGLIIFGDNCISAPYDMTPGYYEIDGETYFCPGDDMYNALTVGIPSHINYCQKIMLKI